jgi:hypothetical protein
MNSSVSLTHFLIFSQVNQDVDDENKRHTDKDKKIDWFLLIRHHLVSFCASFSTSLASTNTICEKFASKHLRKCLQLVLKSSASTFQSVVFSTADGINGFMSKPFFPSM